MGIQSLKAAILASNPVGYYPLDNLADLGHDESPYANHGVQSGTFLQQTRTLFDVEFTMAKGVSSPLVSIPDLPAHRGSTFTFECILSDAGIDNFVIAERGASNTNWYLQSVGIALGLPNPPGVQFLLGPYKANLVDGRAGGLPYIYHLVASSSAGRTFIWVNGQQLQSGANVASDGVQSNQGPMPIHLFSRGGLYETTGAMAHVAMYDRLLSAEEIGRHIEAIAPVRYGTIGYGLAWANLESRSQAFPGANHWAQIANCPPELAAPITQLPHSSCPPTRAELGYISGVVTVKQVPAPGRIVRCFDPSMILVGQTVSDATGSYRFDNLLRNRMYLVLAQDNDNFDYSPASADRRKPEAYAA